MLSREVASTKPVLARGCTVSAAGADAVAHATAGAAVLGVLESGAAGRDAARGEAVRAVRRGLRIGRDRRRASHRRVVLRDARGGPSHRPLDHRPPGLAAGIVRIGEPRPAPVLEGVGADVALRQVGPGIARHRHGLRGVGGRSRPPPRTPRCRSPLPPPLPPPSDPLHAPPCPTRPTASGSRARTWRSRSAGGPRIGVRGRRSGSCGRSRGRSRGRYRVRVRRSFLIPQYCKRLPRGFPCDRSLGRDGFQRGREAPCFR